MYLPFQTRLQAQKTVPAAGGLATGNNGSISYTVGQVFYSSLTSTTGKVTEGVQQAYEISHVNSSHEIQGLTDAISVYPNPTNEIVLLKFEKPMGKNLHYKLHNAHGQILSGKTITNSQTIISLGNYVPAIYFLKIFQNQKEIISFKILKQ
jgi:hypothetical protein